MTKTFRTTVGGPVCSIDVRLMVSGSHEGRGLFGGFKTLEAFQFSVQVLVKVGTLIKCGIEL